MKTKTLFATTAVAIAASAFVFTTATAEAAAKKSGHSRVAKKECIAYDWDLEQGFVQKNQCLQWKVTYKTR